MCATCLGVTVYLSSFGILKWVDLQLLGPGLGVMVKALVDQKALRAACWSSTVSL